MLPKLTRILFVVVLSAVLGSCIGTLGYLPVYGDGLSSGNPGMGLLERFLRVALLTLPFTGFGSLMLAAIYAFAGRRESARAARYGILIGSGATIGSIVLGVLAQSFGFALYGALYGTATAAAWVACHWLTRPTKRGAANATVSE